MNEWMVSVLVGGSVGAIASLFTSRGTRGHRALDILVGALGAAGADALAPMIGAVVRHPSTVVIAGGLPTVDTVVVAAGGATLLLAIVHLVRFANTR